MLTDTAKLMNMFLAKFLVQMNNNSNTLSKERRSEETQYYSAVITKTVRCLKDSESDS
jgi:hypothetical protein